MVDIRTEADWKALASKTIPLLPSYMSEFSWVVDEDKVLTELTTLFDTGNFDKLHERFEEIWAWLPESPIIRHRPFFDLCDLCSEYKVWEHV